LSDDLYNRFFHFGNQDLKKNGYDEEQGRPHRYEDFGQNKISKIPIPEREQTVYDDFPSFQNQKHLNKMKNNWDLHS